MSLGASMSQGEFLSRLTAPGRLPVSKSAMLFAQGPSGEHRLADKVWFGMVGWRTPIESRMHACMHMQRLGEAASPPRGSLKSAQFDER